MKLLRRLRSKPVMPTAKPPPAARAPEAVVQLQLPPPRLPDGTPQFNGTGCLDDETVARLELLLAVRIAELEENLRPSFDIVCVEQPPQDSSQGIVQRLATTIGLWFPPVDGDVDTAAALAAVNLLEGVEADENVALLRSRLSRELLENLVAALSSGVEGERVVFQNSVQLDAASNSVTTTAAVHRRKRDGSAGLKYVSLCWKETPKRDTLGEVCPPRPPVFALTDRRFDRFLERDHKLDFLDRWTERVARKGVLGELLALLPFPKRIPAESFVALLTGERVFPSLRVSYDEPRVAASHVAINGRIAQVPSRLPCVAIRRADAVGPAAFDPPSVIEVEVSSDETEEQVELAVRADVFDVREPTIRWQVDGATASSTIGSSIVIRVPTTQLRPFGRVMVNVTATAQDVEFDPETNLPAPVQSRRQVVFRMPAVVQRISA